MSFPTARLTLSECKDTLLSVSLFLLILPLSHTRMHAHTHTHIPNQWFRAWLTNEPSQTALILLSKNLIHVGTRQSWLPLPEDAILWHLDCPLRNQCHLELCSNLRMAAASANLGLRSNVLFLFSFAQNIPTLFSHQSPQLRLKTIGRPLFKYQKNRHMQSYSPFIS